MFQKKTTKKNDPTPKDTGSKLKPHKMSRRRKGDLLNALCTPNPGSVSRCQEILIQGILDPINLSLLIFLYIDHF